jgi:photosystem II stability/assembly factor-like uncharacterized protein
MKHLTRSVFSRFSTAAILLSAFALAGAGVALARQYPETLYSGMRWRTIGPLRAGRTRAACGVPSEPNVFYIGSVNGGVWKSTDYGRTWHPIFNHEPTGSIGAIAVSPSDPNIIYVGSGEGLHRPDLAVGDGMYKSTDAGKTWVRLGLRQTQQIANVAVDPNNPDVVFVAALGHPYGPNPERGIFRSTDGGKTFRKVFYINEYTGGSDVEIDPQNPQIVYAAMWQAQEAPWENGAWGGSEGGLFKSTDGGNTWHKIMTGFPEGVIQVDVAIAASEPSRLYATVAYGRHVGIFRSDDAGAHWVRITNDPRPERRIGGGDLPVPKVDPKNPNVVYVTSVVTWRSTDGGKTWTGIRGAPGGDDYQNLWINPDNPNILLLASDQGGIVSVNGGKSWSSWYNQLTAQVYHVNTDNAFPYRVCSGQQDSGSACVSSRGNWGEITERDWLPAGAQEYGYLVPDPLNPNIVYGGKLTRFNRLTGQTSNVAPKPLRGGGYRDLRTEPIVFSPVDPHILYFAANTLWETRNGGDSWRQISPDLSRKTWPVPSVAGKYASETKVTRRGVIYALAPSPLNINVIWAGTDDGLIWLTRDGGRHWENVTPPQLKPWEKVSILDAGHFTHGTVYAAINTLRLDDLHPLIYKTHDFGKTWTRITSGLPDNEPIDVVRQDPKRKGLLFAGSETQVSVSFDDGAHWQSLRLNMPASSVRDIRIHGNDLIAGTHGRGFWILDDITPLRQIAAAAAAQEAYLFRPELATRVRWNVNTDTPLPPDVPHAQNPPDGAVIDYYLKSPASGTVTLEILDSAGKLVRRYASTDKPSIPDPNELPVPAYWARPAQILSPAAGMHRFIWDLHWTPAPGFHAGLPMQAVVHDTPVGYTSPWVLPGRYTIKLTVDGQTYTQPMTIRMDPRVKTPMAGLVRQFTLSKQLYDGMGETSAMLSQAHALERQLNERKGKTAQAAAGDAIAAFEKRLDGFEGRRGSLFALIFGGGHPSPSLTLVRYQLSALLGMVQQADVGPTEPQIAAAAAARQSLAKLTAQWNTIKTRDLAHLNYVLKQANLAPINLPAAHM